ncbi:DUF2808 domain-containing protein [Chroococcidiopsis sp. FACHB-1243]|uniref:DUF2808 domain-containing protein n=1 Tax=Chroococcidiopsis sp. [FACHB-1243] TaxID=2692781 RepID=UPI00177C5C95|nr:DUF2808 domain-containing protein [Chroococcidiopsis sp. [FACHB-1243]]MBD2304147.1 DUF2808 domain-containing protein [Chroococcidiopsis sp. [FACHB-1243]]
MVRQIIRLLGTAIAVGLGLGGVIPSTVQAVKLGDGSVAFVQPPDLLEATTTFDSVSVWGATYYFTIAIPKAASEPLQRVTIHQKEGADNIRYKLDDTRAFVGTRRDRGDKIQLGEVTHDRETRTVTVNFDPPIPPGRAITIGLRPRANPTTSGVYLFGVTAFPPGEKVRSQFMGFGRLHFYNNGGSRDIF